ncbi:MAG: TonB-dependent receptor [Pseudomonadota bacterium]
MREWGLGKISFLALLSGASYLAFSSTVSLAQVAKPDDDDDDEVEIEQMLVTATKRAESIKDIPFSITAFGEQELLEQGITDFSELATAVPGVTLQEGGPGFRSIIIRGISSTDISVNAAATGFYYDESFIEPAGVVQAIIEPIFFDVERVEVLRGPQGTLFGGSSLGGTVRFISNKPVLDEFEAAAGAELSGTQSGGFNYNISSMVNVPIVTDKLGVRVVGSFRNDSGFIDRQQDTLLNPTGVTFEDGPVTEDINDSEYIGVRAIVDWLATERLSIRGTFAYQDVEQTGFPSFDSPPETFSQIRPFNLDEFVTDEFVSGNIVINYEFDNFELTSSTTYYDRDSDFREDGSFLPFAFLIDGDPSTGVDPLFGGGPREDTALIEELRIASTWDKPINFVAGIYYEDYERDVLTEFGTEDIVTGVESVPPAFAPFTISGSLNREQIAGFFEATYEFAEKWELTLGVRAFSFSIDDTDTDVTPNTTTSSSELGASPRASIAYKYSEDQTYYATVSRGFRPGGPNGDFPVFAVPACQAAFGSADIEIGDDGSAPDFTSDNLWNFEAGGKTSWLNGRVNVNASGYYIRWIDIQQLVFFPGCPGAITLNAGRADVFGAEVEFDFQITEALSFFGGFNFNEAELGEDTIIPFGDEGTPIANTPRWTANINARYEHDFGNYFGFALVNYRFIGESFRTFGDFAADPQVPQGDYSLVGIRLGVNAGNWQIAAFVDNLNNSDAGITRQLSTFEPLPFDRFFTVRPRTFGINFRVDL